MEAYKFCKDCSQPIKPGRHKLGEYSHAQGCPNDRSDRAVSLAKRLLRSPRGPIIPMREAIRLNFLDAWEKCGHNVLLTAKYLKSGKSSVQRWKDKYCHDHAHAEPTSPLRHPNAPMRESSASQGGMVIEKEEVKNVVQR